MADGELRHLGLFEGIGGISLGLERVGGFHPLQFVEIDPYCQAVLGRHWPDVPVHADIHDFHAEEGAYDIISAGFPCQPASLAGRRKGKEDPRWLWPDTARVVGDARPRYVFLENVRGLCSRGLSEVLADLAGMGYDAEWQVVSAAALGAPHIRERVCIVAYPVGLELRLEPGRGGGQGGERAALAGLDGEARDVADPDGKGREQRPGPRGVSSGGPEPADGGADVADAGGPGRIPEGLLPRVYTEAPGGGTLSAAPRASELARAWAVEPDVGRVAHGVPNRLDRLRTLGNAVVPQVAEFIGGIIMDMERRRV